MARDPKPSFWTSLPGILTGMAAVLTALVGLYTIYKSQPPTPQPNQRADPVSSHPGPEPSPSDDTGVLIDDADSRVHYSAGGGWKDNADYHLLKSTQHWTNNPGSTATLEFRGNWIEIAYYRELGGTLMSVDIDGSFHDPVDCGSLSGKTEYMQRKKFTRLGPGEHTIILMHTGVPTDGRAPRSFGDYTVNIDGFRVSQGAN
jgi:hypothetical protein